jgi:hypothetical protein
MSHVAYGPDNGRIAFERHNGMKPDRRGRLIALVAEK